MDEKTLARYKRRFQEAERDPLMKDFVGGWKPHYTPEEYEDRFQRYCKKLEALENHEDLTYFKDESALYKPEPIHSDIAYMVYHFSAYGFGCGFLLTISFGSMWCLLLALISVIGFYNLKTKRFMCDYRVGGRHNSTYVPGNQSYIPSNTPSHDSLAEYRENLKTTLMESRQQNTINSQNQLLKDMMGQQKAIADRQEFHLHQLSNPYSTLNYIKKHWNWQIR